MTATAESPARERTGPTPVARAQATSVAAVSRVRVAGGVVLLALRAVWRAVGPVLTVVSGTGWIVLLVATAFAVAGFLLGWQEFVYIAVTLVGGVVFAVLFIFGRASFGVEIELNPRRVIAGERALGSLVVTNTGQRTSAPARFELPVGAGVAEFMLPGIPAGDNHEELFAVPTNRRAVIVAGPAVSVRGDQLGLMRRTVRWTDPVELFVHPITARLKPSAAGLVRDLEGEVTKTITNNDISFHALRAYEPGDDRRYVHWRTSARTGQLMVRQFEETRRSQLTIVFNADRKSYASAEEFELAVSVMASLGVQVLRDGTKLKVVSEKVILRTLSPTGLLDDSCRLEPTGSPFRDARDFVRQTTLRLPPPSVAMVVTGSLFPTHNFRAIETLFGNDTTTIGFRADVSGQSRVSRVAGLPVVTVASLDDLPRLVRRVR